MERKAGVNKVKLHSYLLLPDSQEQYNLTREDPFVQVNIRGGKETRFTFDDCFHSNGNNIPEGLTAKISVSVQMALMGYASTLLIYSPPITTDAVTTSGDFLEAEIISELTHEFYDIEKVQSIAGDYGDSSVTSTCSIEACCYELIDNQIRDLTSPSSSSIFTSIGGDVRLREGDGQFFVDGVQQALYTDHPSLLAMIHTALTRRSISTGTLPDDSALTNDNNDVRIVVLGAIGTVFFQFRVITTTSFTINNHTHILKKQAVMTVISLATNDALVASMEFKGTLHSLVPSLTSQLRNSMKAIATLSRVINSLVERSSSEDSGKKVVHVPFRDSMLTRLLRSSLEGNTFLSMITRTSKDLESAARALRFASQISSLHNVIWIKEELIMTRLLSQLRQSQLMTTSSHSTEDTSASSQAGTAAAEEADKEIDRFQSAVDAMKQEMFSLQVDLDRLEGNREAALRQLSIAMQTIVPVNNSSSSSVSSSNSSSQGGFKLQEIIIDEENRLRADFNHHQQLLQQAATAAAATKAAEAERLELEKEKELELQGIVHKSGSRSRSSSPRSKLRPLTTVGGEADDSDVHSDAVMSSTDELLRSPQRQQLKPILHRSSSLSTGNSKGQRNAAAASTMSKTTPNSRLVKAMSSNHNSSIVASSSNSKPLLGPLNLNQSQSAKLQSGSNFGNNNIGFGNEASHDNNSNSSNKLGSLVKSISSRGSTGLISSTAASSPSTTTADSISNKGRILRRQEASNAKNSGSNRERSRTAAVSTRPILTTSNSRPNIAALAAAELKEQEQFSPIKSPLSQQVGVDALLASASDLINEQKQIMVESSSTAEEPVVVAAVKPFDISRLLNNAQSAKDKECEQRRLDREQDSGNTSNTSNTSTSSTSSKLPSIISPPTSPSKVSPLLKNKSNAAESSINANKIIEEEGKEESGRQCSDDHDGQTSLEEETSADNSENTQATSTEQPQGSLRRIIRREMWGAADNDWSADDDLSDLERRFLRAVATGNMTNTLRCLQEGVDVHVKNTFERDAMQIASRWGSVEMLQLLESHGGSISSRGPKGDSLYHLAAYNGHIDTMRWLQSKGIFTEGLDIFGQNVVHIAARRGEISVLKYLQDEIRIELFTQEDFDGRIPQDCIPRRGPAELQQCREFFANLGVDEEENLNLVFARIRGVDW